MASRIGKLLGTKPTKLDARIFSGADAILSVRDAYTTIAAGESQSTFDKILDTTAAIGSVADLLNDFLDKAKETRDSLNDAQRVISSLGYSSRTIEDVFELVQKIPNSLVRKIAKAAEAGADTAGAQLKLLNDALNAMENKINTVLPLQKPLQVVALIGDVAAVTGLVKDLYETWQTRDYDYLDAFLDFLIGDFDDKSAPRPPATPPEPLSVALPDADENQNVANDFQVAMDAFSNRFQARENEVLKFEQTLDAMRLNVEALVPAGTANVQEWVETEITARINAVSAILDDVNGTFDNINVLSDIIDPLDDVAGVLRSVQEAIQPVLDFFGPVTALIDSAISALEDVLGLSNLEAKIKQAIQDGVSTLFDPIKQKIEDAIDAVGDAVFGIMQELLTVFVDLRQQALEIALNPIGVLGDTLGETDDVLTDAAIAAGGGGDDILNLVVDNRFDDGYGAFGLGGTGNDTLRGTELADMLNGGADDDLVLGLAGDDLLFGGSGTNTVDGGAGNDAIFGGADRDLLSGGSGNDKVYGDAGNDDLDGGAGNDLLDGEDGDDILRAGAGNDSLLGGSGNDTLIAAQGDNTIDGQDGLDVVRTLGTAEATHLLLDATASLIGGAGRDTVSIGDAFGEGQSVDPGIGFDGGANEDLFIAGNFDALTMAPRVQGFETLEINSAAGESKLLVTDADSLRSFRKLDLTGNGEITIDVRAGDFRMDGLFDDQAFLINTGRLAGSANPQDGANAGVGGQPASTLANVTVKLSDPGGATASGQVAATRGITFQGSGGADLIVGGGGSDIIIGGLGADTMDGGPSDSGDRFDLDSAIGDVFLGTPEELDGDTIRNLSNRVDRVRVTGSQDYVLQVTSGSAVSTVAIYASQSAFDTGEAALGTFTLEGEYPKLITRTGTFDQDGTVVPYVEILNNNVPPTAVGENIVTRYQGEGDDPLAVDPLANDYDVDTPASDGVERRQIAVTESLSSLFRLIEKDGVPLDPNDPEFDDLARAAFRDGLTPVAVGTEITTELGNKLIFTATGIVYEAPTPTLTLRGIEDGEGFTIFGTDDVGQLDLSEGLPFFGRDRIDYKVFDLEGEVSNRASLDILIRPDDVTNADGSTSAPAIVVTTTADPAIVTGGPVTATLVDVAPGTTVGTERADDDTALASFATGNDRFKISDGGAYYGLSGEDVMIAETDQAVQLYGGRGADWLEGGAGNDFLSAGGYDDTYLDPETRLDTDAPEPMNILLGGAGDNVFASSFGNATGDLPRAVLDPRDTVFVLDGGAEVIAGSLTNLGAFGGIQDPGRYGVLSATEALQDDVIIGFDTDDQIVLGMDRNDLTGVQVGSSTYDVPDYTGIVSTDLDMDAYLGMTPAEVLNATGPFSDIAWQTNLTDRVFHGAIVVPANGFNGFPAIVTHKVSAQPFDANGGKAPYTLLTVSLKAYEFQHDTSPEADETAVLVENPILLDPLGLNGDAVKRLPAEDLIDGAHVTFSMELDGFYQDRFTIDMVELLTNGPAPFVQVTERSAEYGDGTYRYEYFDSATVHDIEGAEYNPPGNFPTPPSGKDGNIGLSIKYVSEAPETTDDTGQVRRGDAITLNLTANDTDVDGDAVQVFDYVFQDQAQRDRLTDGDTLNGELIEQVDLNTGFGTGVVTYVAPRDFIGLEEFSYIATDGEYQTEPTGVSINVTGLPPTLGDDRIILSADTSQQIRFADLLANDFDPDAGEAPDMSTIRIKGLLGDYGEGEYDPDLPVTIPGFTPPPPVDPTDPDGDIIGGDTGAGDLGGNDDGNGGADDGGSGPATPFLAELTPDALAQLTANTINPDGSGGTSVSFQYTLGDVGEGGRSQAATVEVLMAADFALADNGLLNVQEDSSIAVDILAGRSGGFGEVRILSVSTPLIEGTDLLTVPVLELDNFITGTAEVWGNGIVFTPKPNLSGVTTEIRVTVADDLNRFPGEEVVVRIAIDPVDDAPVIEQTTPGTQTGLIEAIEDVEANGTVRLFDVDAAAPIAPATLDPIETEAGGSFQLTPTATPGIYGFTFTPAADYAGADRVEVELAGTGETVALDIDIVPQNDAPRFDAPDGPVALNVGSDRLIDLLAPMFDIDGQIDPASLQIEQAPDPSVASVELQPGGLVIISGADSGQTQLAYSVADQEGLRSAVRTIEIDINAAPNAEDERFEIRDLTQSIAIDAIANDSDLDGTIAYATDANGLPVAIDPARSVDPDAAASLLGSVVWSEADGVFLYTPPSDPTAFGKTDLFHYEIIDDDGAASRGTVFIDLIAPNQQALRIASADKVTAASDAVEEFLLGSGSTVLSGTTQTLHGDAIFGFGLDDALVLEGDAAGDVTLSINRLRTDLTDPVDLSDLGTAAGLFGTATLEDLSAAFIGDTELTIETPGGVATLTLSGAYLGAFTVADNGTGGSAIAYAPTLEGAGDLVGSDQDDDLRGTDAGASVSAGQGDDVLRQQVTGGTLDGGAGRDALSSGDGLTMMTGGSEGDLFLIQAGSEPVEITDFNPYDGDRFAIADQTFLNDDQTVDLERVRVEETSGAYRIIGNPNPRDDDGVLQTGLADVVLATFTLPAPLNAIDDSASGDEDTVLTGDLSANDTGLDGYARTYVLDTAPSNGAVVVNEDGTYAYTPAPDFFGDDSFVYRVTVVTPAGPIEQTATVSLTVEPVNDAPIAADDTGFATDAEVALVIPVADLLANDGDTEGTTVFLDQVIDGVGGTVQIVSETVVFTPTAGYSGPASFEYTVSDGELSSAAASVFIEVIETNPYVDFVQGTEGADWMIGDAGVQNSLFGAGGADVVVGRGLDDHLAGGEGNDKLVGGWGKDSLDGNEGADLLLGGWHDDVLAGQEGNDRLVGGVGDDLLEGGLGNDRYWGGLGSDTFVYRDGDGDDLIWDFFTGVSWLPSLQPDALRLEVTGIDSFADVQAVAVQSGTSTILEFADGGSVTLAYTQVGDLEADHFQFL